MRKMLNTIFSKLLNFVSIILSFFGIILITIVIGNYILNIAEEIKRYANKLDRTTI